MTEMQRYRWAIVPLFALIAVTAQAGIITQIVPYSFSFDETPIMTLEGFDDLGGTQQLDSVTFDWDLNYDVDYRLENTGPTALNVGDFAITLDYYNVHQLGLGEGSPAYGPGGMYMSLCDVALGANDEMPGGDDVAYGSYSYSYERALEFTAAANPTIIDAMTRPGSFDTVYGGFGGLGFTWINEPVGWDPPSGPFGEPVYPTDDALWFFFESTCHFGDVTVTYEYSAVPEPATAGILGGLTILLVLRRRS